MTVEHMRLLPEAQIQTLVDELCLHHHAEGCAPLWINVPCVDRMFRPTQHYGVIDNGMGEFVNVTTVSWTGSRERIQEEHLRLNAEECNYIRQEMNRLIPGLRMRVVAGGVFVYATPEWSPPVLRLVLYRILLGLMDDD